MSNNGSILPNDHVRTINAIQILEQIKTEWYQTRASYRDGKIKVGSLIRQYIVQCLKELDGLNEHDRAKSQLSSREQIIRSVMRTLNISNTLVNELIRISVVYELLCQPLAVDLGKISYSSLRTMRIFVYRCNRGVLIRRGKKTKTSNEIEPSQLEQWSIRPCFANKAQEIVRRAIVEQWTEKQLTQEINLTLSKVRSSSNGGRIDNSLTGTFVTREPVQERIGKLEYNSDLIATEDGQVRSIIPNDDDSIVERITNLCLASDDPDKIIDEVRQKIESIRTGKIVNRQRNSDVMSREERIAEMQRRAALKLSLT